MKKTIKETYHEDNIMIDPHTAVAKNVYLKYLDQTKDTTYTCIVSTASPFKFSEDTYQALYGQSNINYKDAITKLSKNSCPELDQRMVELLKREGNKIPLSKKDALGTVLEKIGELNDNN